VLDEAAGFESEEDVDDAVDAGFDDEDAGELLDDEPRLSFR
jgi:predicted transcriptional regulator